MLPGKAFRVAVSGFELFLQICNKLGNLAVVFIVFLAVGDEDVVFVTSNKRSH